MRARINIKDVQRIVREELSSINEQVDHASIKDIVTAASKLIDAVQQFRSTVPGPALNAVTPNLDQVAASLEDMLSNPGSYVPIKKAEPKKVSLRSVKTDK